MTKELNDTGHQGRNMTTKISMDLMCIGDSLVAGYPNVWGPQRNNDEIDLLFCPLHSALRPDDLFILPMAQEGNNR